MDFPIQLKYNEFERSNSEDSVNHSQPGIGSNLEFVYGYEELKQDIYLLLKTIKGFFLQDLNLGTLAVPHTVDGEYIQSMVTRCVEQIKGVQCLSVTVVNDRLYLQIQYQGEISNFDYSVISL